jgi:tetratricopeptide (TPR) repeat protein
VILPVTLRNLFVGHDFVPIAWQGGVNFFIGNNPGSNGITAVVPGTRADWWGGFEDTRRIAEQAEGRTLKPSEISLYWYQRSFDFLANEPKAAFRLYVRKLVLLLGNAEPSNERQLQFRREHSAILQLLFVNFSLVLATAAIGVWVSLRTANGARAARLLPLYFTIPYAAGVLAFFVTSRFRLPVVMFVIPLSAAGCVAMYQWIRIRQWRAVGIAALAMATVLIVSTRNPYGVGRLSDARGYYGAGLDHFKERDYDAALLALNSSIESDSSFAPAWAARGRVHEQLGRSNEAIHDLERACALDPAFADALYWLGVSYQKAGQHPRARSVYIRSIELDSTRVEAFTNLADVCFRQRRLEEAHQALTRALRLDSTYVNANYGMGYYHEVTGDTSQARTFYEKAVPFRPAAMALERLR